MRTHKHKFDRRDGICNGCGIHDSEYRDVLEAEVKQLLKEMKVLEKKTHRLLSEAIKKAWLDERERCAKIAEEYGGAWDIAAAIREGAKK